MGDVKTTIEGMIPLPLSESDWEINVPYEFHDLGIVIEYLAGDTRTKITDTGASVSGVMPVAYGYILRTTDIHGEEIDMYLASMPDPESKIYVIDQINPNNRSFDEHKVMLGFSSIEEVIHTYHSVFSDGSGPDRIGAISTFSTDSFKTWCMLDGSFLLPASRYESEDSETTMLKGVVSPPRQKDVTTVPIDETGGVLVPLPDLSNGPKLHVSSSEVGCFEYHLYMFSPLELEEWSNTIDTLCRTMSLSSDKDIFHIHLASPGGSVILMGRIISAINSTASKVITYAEGQVASAATAIWLAGHERHITPGAFFMQHMSSQILGGKSSDIQAKSMFCVQYIKAQLEKFVQVGLFTAEEVEDMIEKSSDIFISGRDAITRVGAISYK